MRQRISNTLLKGLQPATKPFEVLDTDLKGFLLRVQPSGEMTYYLSYRNAAGQRHRIRLGPAHTLSPTEARTLARQRAGDVLQGADPQHAKREQREAADKARRNTFGIFLEERYLPWSAGAHKGHKETERLLTREFSFLANLPLPEITAGEISAWETRARKKGLAPTTINRRVAVLKAALQKAADWGLTEFNPLTRMKLQRIDRRPKPRYLSADEEARLRCALNDRQEKQRAERERYIAWQEERGISPLAALADQYTDHLMPIILLAMNTGLRRGELFNLIWADVDLARRQLTVLGDGAKSGQTRVVPLNTEAHTVLSAWCPAAPRSSALVFPSPATGRRFDNIGSAWENLLREAGIESFRFHDLRHHFASKLVMAGADLNVVRELLGHADISTTLRYAHLAPEHRANAVALLDQPKTETR